MKQCKKGCLRAKFARLGAGELTILTADQKLYEMTASIKERGRQVMTEDHVEDQEIKLENKEEQLNQLKETLSERERN